MGEKGKKKISTAKLELDKSMHKRTKASNDTALESPKIWYTPPVFSNGETAKLYYQRSEKISIDVNAICEHFEDNNLKFEWECVVLDGSGYVKRFTNATKSPHAVISVLNNIDNDHNIQISAIISDINNPTKKVNAKNCITIRPVITPKEISDKIKWLRAMSGNTEAKDNSTFENIIRSTIEIYGYNGEDVTVNRVVILKGKVIFDVRERVIVSNNCLLVKFNRSEIINKTKNGDTVTLKYVIIVNAWGDDNYKAVKRDFKIDKHTLVEGETVDISQPVVCGTIDIQENTFKQCKYRKIEAEYTKDKKGTEKEKITIFQENDSMEPLPLNLIGGKRKVNITLSEYTPDKCRLKEGSHKSNNKAILTGYNIKDTELLDINGSKVTREFEYDYGHSIAGLIVFPELKLFQLLSKHFWPTRKGVIQAYTVFFDTCRHTHLINIKMYPDIEFEFAFIYKNSLGLEKLQNIGIDTGNINPYQSPTKILEMEVNLGYSLSLKTKINDGAELSLDGGIKKKIETTFGVLDVLKKLLDKILGLENKENISDTEISIPTTYKRAQLNPRVLTAFMKTPSAAVGIKWKANYASPNNAGVEVKMYAKIDPLLHIGLYFDVISFVGKYGGGWGKVVEGVRKFLNLAFNTQIKLYIMVSGKSKIEIGGEKPINKIIDAYQSEGVELGYGMAIAEMQAGLEVDVNGKFVLMDVKFKAELYGKGGLYYKLSFGADSEGLYHQHSFGNTSIEATGKISGGVSWGRAEGTKSTDYGTVITTQKTDANHSIGKTFIIVETKEWVKGEKSYFN